MLLRQVVSIVVSLVKLLKMRVIDMFNFCIVVYLMSFDIMRLHLIMVTMSVSKLLMMVVIFIW